GRADAVPPAEYKEQWKTVVRHLKTLCGYAQRNGKQVCLEPLNRFETDFINTCDQAIKMIDDVGSPALKLHLDTFHMNIEEKDQAAAIRKAGKLLGHFHACGSDRGTPGKDSIDWPSDLVCLEPLNRFETDFINTCDQAIKMIDDVGSPALKLHLDTFHMNIEEKDQAAAIRKAGKLLGHFHACGSDRGTPGKDSIDWP